MRLKLIGLITATTLALGSGVIVTLGMSRATSAPLARSQEDTGQQAIVSVDGMMCSMCASSVQGRLEKLQGVHAARVDVDKKTAVVTLKSNETVTEDSIRNAVRAAGFKVTAVEWRSEAKATLNHATAEFEVTGMACARCAANLARVLEQQPGVTSAQVDADKKVARVAYDSTKTDPESIIKAIESLGVFRATVRKGASPTGSQQ